MPTSWGVFVVIGIIATVAYGIFALYRREMATCPIWMRNVLAALRCFTMLLLAAIFLNPAMVDVHSRTIEPTIVVCRDASASMRTADEYADPAAAHAAANALGFRPSELREQRPTRVQVVNQVLSKAHVRLIESLESKGNIKLVDFAEQPSLVADVTSLHSPLPPLAATSGGTNLAAAIESGLKNQRPAGIILFTDGQHTAPEDVFAAARHAETARVPLFLVGIGDPSQPKVERVTSVFAPAQAWQSEPFEIEAIVRFQNADRGQRRVELFEERFSDGNATSEPKLVATATATVPENGSGQVSVHFSRTNDVPGRYFYRARLETAAPQPSVEEPATSEIVNVLSRQSIRVLLVAGTPTWDYRLVQTLLSRDKTISLSCWLQSLDTGRRQDGTRPIRALPRTKAELFEYDVVLLFDPNPRDLDEAWLELLREFVSEHSGGLLFMAGPQFTPELLATSNAENLASLLPVKIGDLAGLEIESLTAANQNAWPLRLVPANADHPVLRFGADRNENIRRWQSLPGVFWTLPAVDAAPVAQVLADHSNPALAIAGKPRPVMVAGRYGAGNILYLGFSGTWRWRSAGEHAEFFDKFWIQAVRFLVEGRSLEGRRRGYVQTDRDRYEVGRRINISARLMDAAFQPLDLPKVEATLEQPDRPPETISLLAVGDGSGRYETALTAQFTGRARLRMRLPVDGASREELTTSFVVELPSLEASQTWLNRPLLWQLAKESGGRYFEVNELDQLSAAVPNRVEKIEERGSPRPLWDTPGMLIALVGLLSTEWLLRKRFSLL